MEDELIGENEVSRFYRNFSTRSIESYASSIGLKIGLKCIIAEKRDGTLREYVVLDRKNKPIKTHTNLEAIGYFIDAKKKLAKR